MRLMVWQGGFALPAPALLCRFCVQNPHQFSLNQGDRFSAGPSKPHPFSVCLRKSDLTCVFAALLRLTSSALVERLSLLVLCRFFVLLLPCPPCSTASIFLDCLLPLCMFILWNPFSLAIQLISPMAFLRFCQSNFLSCQQAVPCMPFSCRPFFTIFRPAP